MQGGASGSVDEEINARQSAGQQGGAKTGMKGTVGAGSGAPKVTGGAASLRRRAGKRREEEAASSAGLLSKTETPAARRPEFFVQAICRANRA